MSNQPVDLTALLDNEQTAALLGIRPNTLEIWRHKGKGPAFIKMGGTPQAPVRYLRSIVAEWLAQRSFASTSAYSAAARSGATARPNVCPPQGVTR